MNRKEIIKTIAAAAVVGIILFAAAVQYRQAVQYSRAQKALAAGDKVAAVSAFEAAIHMYTPWSPLVGRSAEKLWEIASDAEKSGEVDVALIGYRGLRSSFYAARSLFLPGEEWIRKCNEKIVALEQANSAGQKLRDNGANN